VLTLSRAAQDVAPARHPSSSPAGVSHLEGTYPHSYTGMGGTGYGYSLWEFQVFGT